MVRRRRFATGAAALVAALAFPTDATLAGRRSRGSGALAASHARRGLRTRRKRFGRAPRPPLLRHGRPRAITVRNELKSNRARIAPIAPNAEKHTKSQKNKGEFKADHSLSPQTTQITTIELSPEMASQVSPQNISDGAACVLALIKSNDQIRTHEIALELGVSKRTVLRYIKGLSVVGLRHEGPTKKGRWVFGPKPKGKRGAK